MYVCRPLPFNLIEQNKKMVDTTEVIKLLLLQTTLDSHNDSGNKNSCRKEVILPPPLPYYDRSQQRRTKSEAFAFHESNTKESLTSHTLNQSKPNLYSFRAQHNLRMGLMMDFRADAQMINSRAEEFDTLLADL